MTFTEGVQLTDSDKKWLLCVARESILTRGADIHSYAPKPEVESHVNEYHPAFVTLTRGEELRGCIGHLAPAWPLWETVARVACDAAYRDPRFPPVDLDEMPMISIEISVLTPQSMVTDPRDIHVGRDGLVIDRQGRRGLLLPQVAKEHGWDVPTFLDYTCRKAGLEAGAWKDPATHIYKFQAVVFNEKEFNLNAC